jgi:SSS family solute:Na+ symporter
MGALLASIATTAYFTTGGLVSAAPVNRVQLIVIMAGFLLVTPFAMAAAGGTSLGAGESSFLRGSQVGWPTLLLLGPAFFLSPGLIQKGFGARNERALTRGVALNGLALMAFAALPVMIGLAARALHPGLERPEMALPTVLALNVPPAIGGLAFSAVLSAQLSSADAVLFMLATSGARDFYKGFVRRNATDQEVLFVARVLAGVACLVGFLLTFVLDSVESALGMFYSIMVVTLFAPILGGLFLPRAGRWAALAAMLVGVTTLITIHIATGGLGYGWAAPSLFGLAAGGITYLVLAVF